MTRHERYYQPKTFVIPCECGSSDACWHDGELTGQRYYACAECWQVNPLNPNRKTKSLRDATK